MLNKDEIEFFYYDLSTKINLDTLPPFGFAMLYKVYKTQQTKIRLSLENVDDELFKTMLIYVNLTPVSTQINENYFDEEYVLIGLFERIIKIQKEPNRDWASLLENTYKENPDLFGENTTEAFWKFKKAGILNVTYNLKTDEILFKLTPFSLKFLKKYNDYKRNKELRKELD